MSELEDFRAEKDAFFRDDPRSPLLAEQREDFDGLAYFPEEPSLVLRSSLEIDGVDLNELVVMETTGGGRQEYRRAGIVRFEVDGETAQLTLYAAPGDDELFLPFRDATSGHESYGAGRYVEVEPPDAAGEVEVDFNLAYNPNCAYNPDWACPLPPVENWIRVPIRAGEKVFPGAPSVH